MGNTKNPYAGLTEQQRALAESMVDPDSGEMFGGYLKVDRNIALASAPIVTMLTSWAASDLAPRAGNLATWLLTNTTKLPGSRIKQYAEIATGVVGGVVAFWQPLLASTRIARDHWRRTSALKQEMAPILSAVAEKKQSALAAFFSAGTQNELLRYAQEQVGHETKKEITSWVPKLIESLPAVIGVQVGKHQPGAVVSEKPGFKEKLRNFWYGAPGHESPMSPDSLINASSGLFGEIGRQALRKSPPQSEIPAWQLVKKLVSYVDQSIDNENGMAHHDRRYQRHVTEVKGMVKSILLQHEANMKRPRLSNRLEDEFDEACQKIAERIVEGDVHPMAVAMLAGGDARQRVIRAEGKSVLEPEKLDEILDSISQRFSQQGPMNIKAFYEEAAFTRDDLKEAFAALQGKAGRERRVVLAALFDDAVLADIGIKPEEIKELRKQMNEDVFAALEVAVKELAQIDEKTLRKEYGLSRSETQGLKEFAGTLSSTRSEQEKERLLKGRGGSAIKKILGNTLGTDKGKELWIKRVGDREDEPEVETHGPLGREKGHEKPAHEVHGQETSHPNNVRSFTDKVKERETSGSHVVDLQKGAENARKVESQRWAN